MTSATPPVAPTLVPRPPGLIASPHKSDIFVPFCDPSKINICGVFHAYDPDTDQPNKFLWLEDVRLWPNACNKYRAAGYTVFQYTEYSSPDNWFVAYPNMDIEASLSTSDFEIPAATAQQDPQVTQDSTRTGDATADDERQREINRLRAELEELSRQQEQENQRTQDQARQNPAAADEGVAFINFLNQNQRLMQQQHTAFLNILTQMQHTAAATAPATTPVAPAAALTKPNVDFPSWDGKPATKADFIFRIKTMKRDRFFSNVVDWTQKLAGTEDQSQYLLSEIVDKVPLQH